MIALRIQEDRHMRLQLIPSFLDGWRPFCPDHAPEPLDLVDDLDRTDHSSGIGMAS
jgi:hypothetical protein